MIIKSTRISNDTHTTVTWLFALCFECVDRYINEVNLFSWKLSFEISESISHKQNLVIDTLKLSFIVIVLRNMSIERGETQVQKEVLLETLCPMMWSRKHWN